MTEDSDSIHEALEVEPDSAAAYASRGMALHRSGRYDEALDAFDKALAIQPKSVGAHTSRGVVLQRSGRFDEALDAFDKALAIQPDSVGAHTGRGMVFQQLGRYSEGLDAFDKALTIQPESAVVLLARGSALQASGRLNEALDAFDKALTIQPDNRFARGRREMVLAKMAQEPPDTECSLKPDRQGQVDLALVPIDTIEPGDAEASALLRNIVEPITGRAERVLADAEDLDPIVADLLRHGIGYLQVAVLRSELGDAG